MQTIYVTTSRTVRRKGELVDLEEYRRRQGLPEPVPELEPAPKRTPPPPRRSARRRAYRVGMILDLTASIVLILTALTFIIALLPCL